MLVLTGQVLTKKRCIFSHFLEIAKDSTAQVDLGRSVHQQGTVKVKVLESDFLPL